MPRLKRKSEQMIKKCDSNRKKVKICNDGVDGPQLLMDSNEVKMKCPQTDRKLRSTRKRELMIKKCNSNRKKLQICDDGVVGPDLLTDNNEVKLKSTQPDRKRRLRIQSRNVKNKKIKVLMKQLRKNEDYRKRHITCNSKCQKKRLSNSFTRNIHNYRQSVCQNERLQIDVNRETHNNRQKICQTKRMENPTKKSLHLRRNALCQTRRLQNKNKRLAHNKRLIISQRKRLAIKEYRQIHQKKLRVNQIKRLRDPSCRLIHSINCSRLYSSKNVSKKKKITDKKIDNYLKAIKDGPSHACASCKRLWFKSSLNRYSIAVLISKNIEKEFLNSVCTDIVDSNATILLCSTCKNHILKSKIPPMSLFHQELKFPEVSTTISSLTALEERFVAPRIPFMKIQTLKHAGQFGIHGRVVNVPIDVPTSVKILPRLPHETDVIPIALKKKKAYKSNYLFEPVRPNIIFNAINELKESEVYKLANVVVDTNRITHLSLLMDEMRSNNNDQNNTQSINDIEHRIDAPDKENNVTTVMTNENDINSNVALATFQEEINCLNEFNQDSREPFNVPAEETLLQPNVLVFAPGEGNKPISLFQDAHSESMSFIKIYGGAVRYIPDKMSYQDWVKSEITRVDRRCCALPKIFYSSTKLRMHKISSNISFCLRQTKGKPNVTVGQLLDPNTVNKLINHDNGYKVFSTDRGSPSFWEGKKKEVFAMLRQLGPPTFFLTLSAAETRWPELLVLLKKVVDHADISEDEALQLPFLEKCRLIQQDPVTCSRYFDYRFRQLLNLIKNSDIVFGSSENVVDYYIRIEFQQRGSPHVHCLIWLNNAPVFKPDDIENNEQCCKFVDKYVSCSSSNIEDTLLDYQTHKHSSSCKKVTKSGVKCRFNIPFYPIKETTILYPLEENTDDNIKKNAHTNLKTVKSLLQNICMQKSCPLTFSEFVTQLNMTESEYTQAIRSSLIRPMIFLKREPTEIKINQFNPSILNLHRANMDIQFITEMYSCVQYVLNYINKAKRGISKALADAMEEIKNGDFSIREKLKHLANKFLNASEFSAQEAVYFLLSMPLSKCSRATVFINTNRPEKRVGIVKSNKQLKESDEESTDVLVKNMLDYYVNRPDESEKLCLADFAANYNYSKSKNKTQNKPTADDYINEDSDCERVEINSLTLKNNLGYLNKRRKPKVIRYVCFNKVQNEIEYYREQVMLFFPWRDETLELLNTDITQIYQTNINEIKTNRGKYVYSDAYSGDNLNNLAKEIQKTDVSDDEGDGNNNRNEYDILNDRTDEGDIDSPDDEGTVKPKKTKKPADVLPVPKVLPENVYIQRMRGLNEKQRMYLLHVLHLIKMDCIGLYECVIGGAGVGKSVLIECIEQSIIRFYNSIPGNNVSDLKVLLCAPTGKAAYGIKGVTLHSTFMLPLNQKSGEMPPLSTSTCNTLHATLNSVKLIIIDEVSMVGCRMLANIDLRLRQIFKEDCPFGKRNIIMFGDFNQLPPVGDRFIFQTNPENPYSILIGNSLWSHFKGFQLTEVMRQKDDAVFAAALNRLAVGRLTQDDVKLFKSRDNKVTDNISNNHKTVHLYKTNEEVDSFNLIKIKNSTSDTLECTAEDHIIGCKSENEKILCENKFKNLKTPSTYGLPTNLHLTTNIKYMLTNNINVPDGLVNGAVGILKFIEINDSGNIVRLWLLFEDLLIGKETRAITKNVNKSKELNSQWTPIEKIVRNITLRQNSKVTATRKQFPLVPAEAITIYKSQGGTFTSVAIHLNKRFKRNELYVACSRATSLEGIMFDGSFAPPLPPSRHDPVPFHVNELLSLRQIEPSIHFLQNTDQTDIKFFFHNVQSLHAHIDDMQMDKCLQSADILIFVETWTLTNDIITIPTHEVVFKIDTDKSQRCPYGIIVMKKTNFLPNLTCIYSFNIEEHKMRSNMISFVSDKYCFCVLYKPPSTPFSSIAVKFEEMLQKAIQTNLKVIVVGDFNIDYITQSSSTCFNILKNNKFKLAVQNNQISTNGKTQIDLCFTNFEYLHASYYESYFSYHKPIVGFIKSSTASDNGKNNHMINSVKEVPTLVLVTNNEQNDQPFKSSPLNNDTNVKETEYDNPNSPDIRLSNDLISGFMNTDNVSCYCNSVCQGLFNQNNILQDIIRLEKENSLGMLAQLYTSNEELLDSKPLRSYVDNFLRQNLYCQQEQQDASEFLSHLIQTFHSIKNNVEHNYTTVRRCTVCRYEHRETLPNSIVWLEVLNENSVVTLKKLFEDQTDVWMTKDSSMCSNCGQNCIKEEMYSISSTNNVLIISLGLWKEVNNQIKKKVISLKNVPKDTITVSGHQYKITAAIFHHGHNMQNGHYTAMLRRNRNWFKANDSIVRQSVWPRLSKDAYVFICSKV